MALKPVGAVNQSLKQRVPVAPKMVTCHRKKIKKNKIKYINKKRDIFAVTMSPFCGATGILCFGLQLTVPMAFKARVDTLSQQNIETPPPKRYPR